jgi:nickel transport protein
MKNRFVLLLTFSSISWMTPVFAHGAHISYRSTESIQIQARYDSGEPMEGAQVMVYSPESLSDPWMQGITDDQGQFAFAPDPSHPGNWEVTVRQAGHGDVVVIPVGNPAGGSLEAAAEGAAESSETPAPEPVSRIAQRSPVQQGITIGAVIWGFVGTALFFSRGKR